MRDNYRSFQKIYMVSDQNIRACARHLLKIFRIDLANGLKDPSQNPVHYSLITPHGFFDITSKAAGYRTMLKSDPAVQIVSPSAWAGMVPSIARMVICFARTILTAG